MPTPNGYSNQKMRGPARHQTVQTLGSDRVGVPTAQMYLYEKTAVAIAIIAVSLRRSSNKEKPELTEIEIQFDGPHLAQKFDILRILDNTLEGWEFEIVKVVSADTVRVYNIADIEGVETIPTIGDTVKTLRWTTALSDQTGALQVSQGPMRFERNGASSVVIQDTAVPSNNQPLPTGLYFYKDGVIVPVTKDTGTPANTAAIPVELSGVAGPVNITAGDLNVQLSDLGVNFDATRVGDGSGIYLAINADGSINVVDADVLAELQTLNTVDFSTEAKQDDIITELTTLNTVDFATEAKQDDIITELQELSGTLELSGSAGALNADAIPSTDVSKFKTLFLQSQNAFSGLMTFQFSNDNITWLNGQGAAIAGGSVAVANVSAAGAWVVPVVGKYFRWRMTAYTSGTFNGVLVATPHSSNDFRTLPVSVVSSNLPSGASTSALQTTGNTTLASLLTELLLKAKLTDTQPVSLASVPLPTGAATEATLLDIETKLDTLITSNANRVLDSISNVTATAANVPAPAGAKGFIIQNATISGGALRFTKQGGGASATVGFFLGQGQSTSYIDGAANLAIFDVDGAGLDAAVIWFT